MKYVIRILILLMMINGVSHSGTLHPNVPDEKYTSYAQKYNCVARLVTKKGNKITSVSSCVIINSQWILTAAHIFEDKDSHNTFVVLDKKEYLVSKLFIPTGFDSNEVGYNDIAAGKLKDPITEKINFPELYTNKDELKKVADIVGWGVTGTFDRGAWKDDNKLRAGTNRIFNTDKHLLLCDTSRSDNGSPLEFLISHGDSGGGLFIDSKLAGINSLVFAYDGKPDSTWKDESGHTRISSFIDWINRTITNN